MHDVMQTIVSNLTGPLTELLLEFIVIILGFLATTLINGLRKQLKLNIDEKSFQDVYGTIQGVVKSLNQSIVDDIKAKSADGKLTTEERTAVLQKAKTGIRYLLSVEQNNYIVNKYGSYDEAIDMLIHRALYDIKNQFIKNDSVSNTLTVDNEKINEELETKIEIETPSELSECLALENE